MVRGRETVAVWQSLLDLAVVFQMAFLSHHWEVMCMKLNYLCSSWKSLLEMVNDLAGHGYIYVHVLYLNPKKQDKYLDIDLKLIKKYNAFYNKLKFKDKYYRRKQKGLANFRYLRWENVVVILHTKGKIILDDDLFMQSNQKKISKDKELICKDQATTLYKPKFIEQNVVRYEEDFTDLRHNPIFLEIGEEVVFEVKQVEKIERAEPIFDEQNKFKEKGEVISRKQQITTKMSKDMFRLKKVEFAELVEHQARTKLLYAFNDMLGNLPSWRGILYQKYQLKKFILAHAKKHSFKIDDRLLIVNENRPKVAIKFKEVVYNLEKDKLQESD